MHIHKVRIQPGRAFISFCIAKPMVTYAADTINKNKNFRKWKNKLQNMQKRDH
jgi:hypothetical protein